MNDNLAWTLYLELEHTHSSQLSPHQVLALLSRQVRPDTTSTRQVTPSRLDILSKWPRLQKWLLPYWEVYLWPETVGGETIRIITSADVVSRHNRFQVSGRMGSEIKRFCARSWSWRLCSLSQLRTRQRRSSRSAPRTKDMDAGRGNRESMRSRWLWHIS